MTLVNKKINIENLSLNSEVKVLLEIIHNKDTANYLCVIDNKGCEITIENRIIVIKDPDKKEKEESIKNEVLSSAKELINNKFTFNNLINTIIKTSNVIESVDKKYVKLCYHYNNNSDIILNGNKFILSLKNINSQLIINANDLKIKTNNSNISGSIDSNKCKITSNDFNLSGNLSIISNKLTLNVNCDNDSKLSVFLHCNKNNITINNKYLNSNNSNILRLNVNKVSGYIGDSTLVIN